MAESAAGTRNDGIVWETVAPPGMAKSDRPVKAVEPRNDGIVWETVAPPGMAKSDRPVTAAAGTPRHARSEEPHRGGLWQRIVALFRRS